MAVSPYLALILACLTLLAVDYVRVVFKRGLRDVPGPFFARLTSLYRISITYKGQSVKSYHDLHNKYGKIVRTGPYHVSVSDPEMIPLIYGIASKFRKVRGLGLKGVQDRTLTNTVCLLQHFCSILRRSTSRQYVHCRQSSTSQGS